MKPRETTWFPTVADQDGPPKRPFCIERRPKWGHFKIGAAGGACFGISCLALDTFGQGFLGAIDIFWGGYPPLGGGRTPPFLSYYVPPLQKKYPPLEGGVPPKNNIRCRGTFAGPSFFEKKFQNFDPRSIKNFGNSVFQKRPEPKKFQSFRNGFFSKKR